MILTTRPIDRWDHPETKGRDWSPFKASYSSTLSLLDRELGMLRAKNAVLQVDVTEDELRLDGQLRAAARLRSPRVILAFDSTHGPLKYHCDRWNDWQANLRGIALGLEAQRKLERYGITSRGEQYTGWKALGAGIAMPAASMTVEQAAAFISVEHDGDGSDQWMNDCIDSPTFRNDLYRSAAERLHPDSGGDAAKFQRLQEAKLVLEENDRLVASA